MKSDMAQLIVRVARPCVLLVALVAMVSTQSTLAAEPPTPRSPASATVDKPVLGATMDEVDGRLHVLRIETGGPADRAGMRRGDVVLSIGREQLASFDDLGKALSRHRPQDKVAIVVERDGQTRTLQAVLGGGRSAPRAARTPAAQESDKSGGAANEDLPSDDAPAPAIPATIDEQDLGKTVQGFAQMLRDMTQGMRRGEPADPAAPRPRRPLRDRLSGTAPASDSNAATDSDIQIDLGQESAGGSTSDLAGSDAGAASKPREVAPTQPAPPRRGSAARPRPRLERLRERLGQALDGAEAPAFEGSSLPPSRLESDEPAPRVAARPQSRADGPGPAASQNRRASSQEPLSGNSARRTPSKPALGVTLKWRDEGVIISALSKNGAAEQAGLQVGDVITQIDDRELQSVRDATDYIATQRPGDQVDLKIMRGGRMQIITATLAALAEAR